MSCARCHGDDLMGVAGEGPSLLDAIAVGINDATKRIYIAEGGDMGMPSFARLTREQVDALIAFIRSNQS